MKIFYAAGASPNAYDIKESTLWKNNLFDSLVDLGHEVVAFSRDVTWHFAQYKNYRTSPAEQRKFLDYKAEMQAQLLAELRAEHEKRKIDLFFSYFWSEICDPETIEQIKALGIKTVNWFCNGSYQFDLVADLAPHYDWCLVPEKFRLADYRRVGAATIYCQEAANPKVYKPYDLPREYDVTFVGQAYGDRPLFVRYLLDQGIDVHVWGQGWRNFSEEAAQGVSTLRRLAHAGRHLAGQGVRTLARRSQRGWNGQRADNQPRVLLPSAILGGILPDVEMIKMYSRSKINLGFSTCGNTHLGDERILQIRLRDFEVPMSGGFYIVEYMEELEEFFEIGKEIVCYSDKEDLADKIKYYLQHESEREAIRRAGYERCLRDHSWQRRFQMAFEQMGLN